MQCVAGPRPWVETHGYIRLSLCDKDLSPITPWLFPQGLFADTDDVYKVEVSLILGEGVAKGTFPIRPYGRDQRTYGTIALTGSQLREFLKVWQYQEVSLMRQAMCHETVYGFPSSGDDLR